MILNSTSTSVESMESKTNEENNHDGSAMMWGGYGHNDLYQDVHSTLEARLDLFDNRERHGEVVRKEKWKESRKKERKTVKGSTVVPL